MPKTSVSAHPKFEQKLSSLEIRYRGAVEEVAQLIEDLAEGSRPGDRIVGVKAQAYKVRLANPAAHRGKSGGFRVIYYVQFSDRVVLLTIYSKTEQADISADQIRRLIDELTG